jgi:alpha-soluble NSF attachment protein
VRWRAPGFVPLLTLCCLTVRESAECCRCLDEAKGLYAQEGRLSECAKLAKRRAEIFEKAEIIDLMLESYQEAAELYDGEDQKGETRNCKLKIAHYKSLMDEKGAISEAIEVYEEVAKESLESNLLKWSVKQYYLKALLAALVLAANQLGKTVDDVREKRAEYCSLDPTFEETREDNLIVGCMDAIDEGDMEAFATACNEFDEITKLDSWQTTLLLKAKNGIDNPTGDDAGGEDDDIC